MSYEGYEQHICINGHLFHRQSDLMDMYEDFENRCSDCGGESVWVNYVNETNCDGCGYIPKELFRVASPGVFEVPPSEEVKRMQTYRKSRELYFLKDNTRVVLPEFIFECNEPGAYCVGLGIERAQFPRNNICV